MAVSSKKENAHISNAKYEKERASDLNISTVIKRLDNYLIESEENSRSEGRSFY